MAKAGVLLVGTDDGVVLFSDPGGAGRWLRVGRELRGQAVAAVWLDYETPLLALALVEGGWLWRTDDGGRSWRAALEQPVAALAGGDRHAPSRAVVRPAGGGLLISEDAGATWRELGGVGLPAPAGPQRLVLSAGDGLALAQGDGLWSSADLGSTWVRAALCGALLSLAYAPERPGTFYAMVDHRLYTYTHAGAVWSAVGAAPPALGSLAVLPGKAPALLLATDAGLHRSDDDGASWQPAAADPPWVGEVSVVVPARYNMDVAFAGSSAGALAISTDRGRSWQTIRADLPPVRSISAARLA